MGDGRGREWSRNKEQHTKKKARKEKELKKEGQIITRAQKKRKQNCIKLRNIKKLEKIIAFNLFEDFEKL